jgi:hypothetical protein
MILWPMLVGIIGFIIACTTLNTGARCALLHRSAQNEAEAPLADVSLFLMSQSYASFVVMLAWISSTIARPPAKRAAAIAFINCFSQLGNVRYASAPPPRPLLTCST